MQTSPVVGVNPDLCINCHQCIAVCPVKYCLDGSGDTVKIDHLTCIGCGSCIDACRQHSRYYIDDWPVFEENRSRKKYAAIVAPSAAASFGGDLLKLNGLFASLGVEAFFDVSFGAELTVRSYLDYLKNHGDSFMIAQPCPAIVNYMEIYQPGLLDHLAPLDSPMMHSVKMIREFYPQYADHQIIAISPCIAKKTEFESVGEDVLNLTFLSIESYMKEKGVTLDSFEAIPYTSAQAERAVLFSSPGGLKDTVEREAPQLMSRVRKIEGPHTVYDYFKSLEKVKDRDGLPLLIDCLNCEKGCNGGTGTGCRDFPRDLLDSAVQER
ncbi:MAG: [Fe-Fe] hydrogenase large subunit C-terminal domain-containing protein, partial [Spirochaetales bacterium]|nr:[Fe-Fe] hydrogenase large subunit C-terminal domain-containing protein [Spirochaetales bacterium]